MRTLSRVLAVSCASALTVPLLTFPASAQELSGNEVASSAAYFTASGVPNPAGAPLAPPNLIRDSQVEQVEKGNLAVAASGGQESKVSFYYFSLSSIPFGSKLTSATLTVPLVPDSATNKRNNAKPQNVRVCAPDDTGFSNEDGAPLQASPEGTPPELQYRGAPERKCDQYASAPATQAGEAYVFDISGLASTWDTMNDGVALTKTEDSDVDFQVVFGREATLAFTYTEPVETDLGPDLGSEFSTDLGTTDFGTDDGSLGFDDGAATTDFGGDFSGTTAPLVGGDLPEAPAPETAESPAVAAPRAASGPIELLSLTPAFWLGALLLAGTLGLLGLILGDRTATTAAAAAKPSRLSRALAAPPGSRPSLLGS